MARDPAIVAAQLARLRVSEVEEGVGGRRRALTVGRPTTDMSLEHLRGEAGGSRIWQFTSFNANHLRSFVSNLE